MKGGRRALNENAQGQHDRRAPPYSQQAASGRVTSKEQGSSQAADAMQHEGFEDGAIKWPGCSRPPGTALGRGQAVPACRQRYRPLAAACACACRIC